MFLFDLSSHKITSISRNDIHVLRYNLAFSWIYALPFLVIITINRRVFTDMIFMFDGISNRLKSFSLST